MTQIQVEIKTKSEENIGYSMYQNKNVLITEQKCVILFRLTEN